MFEMYNKSTFDKLNKQHNVMVLVGNGFDVSVLNRYNSGRLSGKTSTYTDFYEYLKYFHLCDEKNVLFKRMTEDFRKKRERRLV